ncbi:hypothetical protein COCOBI_14-4430 [Coccomyxa sp. Obi]|nr:hypothetical protein COCOBI_14-4430 [Coccomyxa sp. Obi]
MKDAEALQILSDYIQGCGEPNTWSTALCPAVISTRMLWRAVSRLACHTTLGAQMGLMVGLHRIHAPTGAGANTSTSDPQDTEEADMRRKRRFHGRHSSAGLVNGCEAPSGPTKVGMRSSRSSSSQEMQPNLAEHAEQRNVAVAGQPNLAANPGSWLLPAKPGNPGPWHPNVAPASGTEQSPSGQHSDKEMEGLQNEIRGLKERNATLNRKIRSLKDHRSQQGAREEEMRAQQLALTQTLSHLVSENEALKAELHRKNPVNQDESCSDSDL